MSKTKNKSSYQLMNKRERSIEEYLELFSRRNIEQEETSSLNDRYKHLYNLNKINQEKIENYRKKMKEEKELAEMAECSFNPKINKDYKYKDLKLYSNKTSYSHGHKSKRKEQIEEISDENIKDLLKRQDEWIKKKNKKMEINKLIEKNREYYLYRKQIRIIIK